MQVHSAALLALLVGTPALVRTAPASQPLLGQDTTETVLERHSKVPFPVRYEIPGVKQTFRLAGTAIRTKTIFGVKVYAMGYYVEPAGAAKALAKWKGKKHAELTKDGALFGALLKDGFGRSMRLVMTRNVDADDMRDAFEDEIRPRVKRIAKDWNMLGGEKALDQFRGFFELDKLRKGTELVFTWMPGGKLHTSISGVVKPTIENEALCWSLFDIWLGEQKLAKKVKADLVRWLPEIIEGEGLAAQSASKD